MLYYIKYTMASNHGNLSRDLIGKDLYIKNKLVINEKCDLNVHDARIKGKLYTKIWTIPLSATPVAGSAHVYISREYIDPMNFGWTSADTEPVDVVPDAYVTVSRIGNVVTFTYKTGEPHLNFEWIQANDYSTKVCICPLVIDFTGTPVEDLFTGTGGNHVIMTWPGAYGGPTHSGIMQIGHGPGDVSNPAPVVKFFPSVGPIESEGIVNLNNMGEATVTDNHIKSDSRITLTMKTNGINVPTGAVFVDSIIDNTSFTIKSTSGNSGIDVWWKNEVPNSMWYMTGWPNYNETNAIPAWNVTFFHPA